MPKTATVPVKFTWSLLEAGNYKPGTFVPQDVTVVVKVPLLAQYVSNLDAVIQRMLSSEKVDIVNVELTPAGVRYCYNELDTAFDLDTYDDSPVKDDSDNSTEWS